MKRKTMIAATVTACPLAVLLGGARDVSAQPTGVRCAPRELDVRIDANGDVRRPSDADGQEGCYFVVNVRNDSKGSPEVSMTLERTNPGGQMVPFDICQGRQLSEPRRAAPGSSQIACYVRQGLLNSLGATTHPKDRNDSAGRPLERGFKYTLRVDTITVDPDLRIER